MQLLARVADGFGKVDADTALKEQALKYLRQWLTAPQFAPFRPQLVWLIREQQWTGLLDRFYQILPFGTGGRRGAVGIGPNRMNLWSLGASVQGHCEYLKERFPGVEPLRVVVAYDVRRFEDQRHSYNPDLPNPVLHLSSRDFAQHAVGVYAANGVHAFILHGDSSMTALKVLVEQGFRVTPVEEQMAPDGLFPNVTGTPNPELPASMDRAVATARTVGADLVLSTDPDADRLGAMIPTRSQDG